MSLKCIWVRMNHFDLALSFIAVDVEDEIGNKARDYNSGSISECESSCDLTTGIQYKT